MDFKLTERERLALGTVLQKLEESEGAVELDWFAKHMKYVIKPKSSVTYDARRKHAKQVMGLLALKLRAMGIGFGRVTTLGRGNLGQYDFDNHAERRKAQKLHERASCG